VTPETSGVTVNPPAHGRGQPRLSQAHAPLTETVEVVNEWGERRQLAVPAERDLTLYLDKRELVTLMTLGQHPEWLALGYLRNQRLLQSVNEVAAIQVDWEVGAAAVTTHQGVADLEVRTAHRVVTTGCGQGSVFGTLMDGVDQLHLPDAPPLRQSELYRIVQTIRELPSVYKQAGSVHGCALFRGGDLLRFVEDVGRHNAVDTLAGWCWLQPPDQVPDTGLVLYTTGRLTSEMVLKGAQMGVAVLVSRSGSTQMGLALAQRLGVCTIGRALHQRFLCFTHPQRLRWDAPPPRP